MEIWEPEPPGTLWATLGQLRDCFAFTYIQYFSNFNRQYCILTFYMHMFDRICCIYIPFYTSP